MPAVTSQLLKNCFGAGAALVDDPAAPRGSHRCAAVLILIYPATDGLEVILTRRSHRLPSHPGQISFPGGCRESADSTLVQTALREAREEIGLDTTLVEILGSLATAYLPSGFRVTPIVGLMDRAPALRAAPSEVEEIFSLPLELVLDCSLYKPGSRVRNGIKRDFYFFDFKNYYIWGATAGILRSFALEVRRSLEEGGNPGPCPTGPVRWP